MDKKLRKLLTLGVIVVMLATVFSVFLIPQTDDMYYQGVDVTPPRNLFAKGYDGYVNLRWEPPAQGSDRVTGYEIFRSLNPENKNRLTSLLGSVQEYRDEDVENGRLYYYWIRAEYGNSKKTGFEPDENDELVQARPFGTSPPTSPKNLEAIPNDGIVELHWEEPDDDGSDRIDGYEIYRGTISGGESKLYTIAPTTSFKDNNVTNGITYYYKIRAYNGAGGSPLSNEAVVTPIADLTTPDAPSNLQAFIGDEYIELHWDTPLHDGGSQILRYKIHRETIFNTQKREMETDGNETYYVDDDIVPGFDYKYKVSAMNVAGDGLTSNEVKAETVTQGFPPAPQNLDAESGDEKVKLSWTEPPYTDGTIVSYHIYRGSTTTGLKYHTTVSGENRFTDKKVENDNTYYYKVKAVSSDKLIGFDSNVDSATPLEAEDKDEGGGMWLPLLIIAIIIIGGILFYVWWMNQQEAKGPQQPASHEWQKSQQEEGTPPPPPESGQNYQEQPPPPGEQQQGEVNNPPQSEPEDEWSL